MQTGLIEDEIRTSRKSFRTGWLLKAGSSQSSATGRTEQEGKEGKIRVFLPSYIHRVTEYALTNEDHESLKKQMSSTVHESITLE